jgi:hypothetical protein
MIEPWKVRMSRHVRKTSFGRDLTPCDCIDRGLKGRWPDDVPEPVRAVHRDRSVETIPGNPALNKAARRGEKCNIRIVLSGPCEVARINLEGYDILIANAERAVMPGALDAKFQFGAVLLLNHLCLSGEGNSSEKYQEQQDHLEAHLDLPFSASPLL